MMQVIDEDYVRGIAELPDGIERLTRWVHGLLDERDTAQVIAKACVEKLQRDLKVDVTVSQFKHEHIDLARLLEWFDKRHDLDLKYVYDMEPSHIPKALLKPGPIPEEGWCVHKEHGGRNDREWTLISFEATALEALRAAHKAFCDGQ